VTKRLSEICDSIDYGVTDSAVSNGDGPKFLRITDIQDGMVDWDSVPHCTRLKSSTKAVLRPGDILFARTGATTGKSFLVSSCPEGAVFASYLIRVRPKEFVESKFLSHYFLTPFYWAQILLYANGAAQPGVNATSLGTLSVPLPPLPEQRRIAAILDQAEALRTQRKKALGLLDELARSVFLEMFGDPSKNPNGWPEETIRSVTNKIQVGVVVKPASYYRVDGVIALRSLNVRPGKIDISDVVHFDRITSETLLAKSLLRSGDVVVVRTGAPGVTSIIPPELDGVNCIDLIIVRPDVALMHPKYFEVLMNSSFGMKTSEDGSNGAAQQHLNVGTLSAVKLPLPPLPLQQEFARRVAAIEALKATHRQALAKLDELFVGLQHRAFRGELTSGMMESEGLLHAH